MASNLIKNLFDFYENHGKLHFSLNFKEALVNLKNNKNLIIKLIQFTLCSFVVILSVVLLNLQLFTELYDEYFPPREDNTGKIDWHDWDLIEEEIWRDRIGERGEDATLWVYPRYSKYINDTHGYNGYLSDQIALNRALKDLRPSEYVQIIFA